jgi:thiol:disulfide interchange protein DsbC
MKIIKNKTRNFSGSLFIIVAIALLAFTCNSYAQAQIHNVLADTVQNNENSSISPEAYKSIQTYFKNSPDIAIERYNQQLIEVKIGARSFLSSNDGRYIFVGKVIDTYDNVDISEKIAQKNRVGKLSGIDKNNQLTFPATTKELFSVTLFTDIDCGYCRGFHRNMDQYNALGIKVNYLMFPRAGKNSPSYDKTAAVLCTQNPQNSMTQAMQGQFSASSLASSMCQKNLDKQMELAVEFGINATPTLILPNGEIVLGALPPKQLLAKLKLSS